MMEVKNIVENEDGSAEVMLDLSKAEVATLLQYAILHLLKDHIDDTST